MRIKTPTIEKNKDLLRALELFNKDFFEHNNLRFVGGTSIALNYIEYRQSDDIDIMSCDRKAFSQLLYRVKTRGINEIFRDKGKHILIAEGSERVLFERDAIRFFIDLQEYGPVKPVKAEIILEERFFWGDPIQGVFGFPTNSIEDLLVGKLLALFDRYGSKPAKRKDLYDILALSSITEKATLTCSINRASAYYENVDKIFEASLKMLLLDLYRSRNSRNGHHTKNEFDAECDALAISAKDKLLLARQAGKLSNLAGIKFFDMIKEFEYGARNAEVFTDR